MPGDDPDKQKKLNREPPSEPRRDEGEERKRREIMEVLVRVLRGRGLA